MSVTKLLANTLIDHEAQSNCHVEHSIAYTHPTHSHDFYEIFVVTGGKCTHKINGQTQILERGAMVFVRPEDTHGYDFFDGLDSNFININFYKDVVENAFSFLGDHTFARSLNFVDVSPSVTFSPAELETITQRFEQIILYVNVDKVKMRMLARSILIDALTRFFLEFKSIEREIPPAWFDELLTQMQKPENFTVGLASMHELSNKSAGHINRVFKQFLNVTPTEYINRLRLKYAKNLLISTNMSIIDVACEAGFENLGRFYHLFKSNFGLPPGRIRAGR